MTFIDLSTLDYRVSILLESRVVEFSTLHTGITVEVYKQADNRKEAQLKRTKMKGNIQYNTEPGVVAAMHNRGW